jgi:hypothetical protein
MMTAAISDRGRPVSWHHGDIREVIKKNGWHAYIGHYDKASGVYYAASTKTLSLLLSSIRGEGLKYEGEW